MNNLQQLDEALDYLNEENIESLLEFNIKDSISTIISNIKKAIVKLIDKAQIALSKCKDSKIKTNLQNILSSAKKLLTKADNITNKEEAEEISKDVKELNDRCKMPGASEEFIKAVKDNNQLRVHIIIGDMFLVLKNNLESVEELIEYNCSINGYQESDYDPEELPAPIEFKNIDKSDAIEELNKYLVMFKRDKGYNKRLISIIETLIKTAFS